MRILYFMHVEWGWIKQRPHFLALELNTRFHTTVFYQTMYQRFRRHPNDSSIRRFRLFNIPLRSLYWIGLMDEFIFRHFFKLVVTIGRFDVIWLTHPDQYKYVSDLDILIIYDCMDNHSEFDANAGKTGFKGVEVQLIKASYMSIFSSNYLFKLNESYLAPHQGCVIYNGISEKLLDNIEITTNNVSNEYKVIMYFGTIANWFDFSVIESILTKCPGVEFILVGPAEVEIPIYGPRVQYVGSVDHSRLSEIASSADIFIMPFMLNDIIIGVDPVKLYEYISFGKPIISVYYSELQKFSSFVNFYSSDDELSVICDKINTRSLSTFEKSEQIEFLKTSTWRNRFIELCQIQKFVEINKWGGNVK